MQTTQSGSGEDPPWLKSPTESKNGRKSSLTGVGTSEAGGSRVSSPLSSGRGRRSYGASAAIYDSELDDNDQNYNEDCCCCPMDPILLAIGFFHGVCLCLGLACIVVNLHHLPRSYESKEGEASYGDWHLPRWRGHLHEILNRSYLIIFAVIMVTCELDWRFLMRRLRLLDLWIFRGFFYLYIGIQTIGQGDNGGVDSLTMAKIISTNHVENLIGTLIIMSGIIYSCLGVCCIKSVAENRVLNRGLARRDATTGRDGGRYREIINDNHGVVEIESL